MQPLLCMYVHAALNWQRENRYQIEAFCVLPTSNVITKAQYQRRNHAMRHLSISGVGVLVGVTIHSRLLRSSFSVLSSSACCHRHLSPGV